MKNKDYETYEVYKCNHCNLEMVFGDEQSVKEHVSGCMLNPSNHFPPTSKHFRIKVYPFTKKYAKEWKTQNAHFEYGLYTRPYNVLLDRELDEEELFKVDETWEARDSDTPYVIETDEYKEFIALLDAQEDVEVPTAVKDFVQMLMENNNKAS